MLHTRIKSNLKKKKKKKKTQVLLGSRVLINHIIVHPERSTLPTTLLHLTNQTRTYSYKIVYT